MKRRRFLGAASAGVAAALWPAFVREAFGETPSCDGRDGSPLARLAVVAAAFRRATLASRPLLVFVIPADDGEKWNRGQIFGELLNHGKDGDLAPLARVEVVCATMADLRKLVPTAGAGEPLMVLVSADRVPATVRQLDATLPEYGRDAEDDSWEARERHDDVVSDQRIAVMSKLLRDTLGEGGKRAAEMAGEVRARLKDKPPAGTKWAHSSGCGLDVEGETDTMVVACGMGHTPKKSQRFLYFFTRRLL